jgi:hypothetical protein
MVGELHKRGYQRLRVMPYIYGGIAWRCSIGPVTLFYRNHGAMLSDSWGTEKQGEAMVAVTPAVPVISIGTMQHLILPGLWQTSFIQRFSVLTQCGRGWDYAYGGWYERLLGYAESGWIPYVFAEFEDTSFERLYLQDVRPAEWRGEGESPILTLPPLGELQQDYA